MQPTRQANLTSIRRDAWIEVDLNSLEHNLKVLREQLISAPAPTPERSRSNPINMAGRKEKGPLLMAVVKSDAYGHGAVSLSQLFAATKVDYLGVASIDEGVQIRQAGVKLPILILSPTPAWAIDGALENNLDITISTEKQLFDVSEKARSMKRHASIHLKVDTGMHRLGVPMHRLPEILSEIHKLGDPTSKSPQTLNLVSVYSHLAKAADSDAVNQQKKIFDKAVEQTRRQFPHTIFHLASSEAATRFPQCHYDMVRIGLYLYGLEPDTVSERLRPAMSVRARINHINTVEAGAQVGYGWTWKAPRPTRLAAIPIGYADGVDRGLSNNMTGLLMGHKIEQVGRISMDQMLFDITDVPQAEEGDVITLIGSEEQNSLDLSKWARSLDTITYELACRLRARLPRIYTRNQSLK